MLTNPVLKNELNAEPLVQSRIVQGSTMGLLAAVGIFLQQVTQNSFLDYDWALMGPALLAIWGTTWSLYGRIATGLKPVFDGWNWFRR